MKRYLFMGGLVLSLSTGAYANNPFDIAKNMQKIEAEDTMLLDTLEEETAKKGDIKSDDFVVSKHVKEEATPAKEDTLQDEAPVVVEEVKEPVKEQKPKAVEPKESVKVEEVSVKIDKEPVAKPVTKPQEVLKPVKKVIKQEPKKEVIKFLVMIF
jgi:hypothetical protein